MKPTSGSVESQYPHNPDYPKGLYPENRPQWKDAPKWAKWLALNDRRY
jgi:hypothetical protein